MPLWKVELPLEEVEVIVPQIRPVKVWPDCRGPVAIASQSQGTTTRPSLLQATPTNVNADWKPQPDLPLSTRTRRSDQSSRSSPHLTSDSLHSTRDSLHLHAHLAEVEVLRFRLAPTLAGTLASRTAATSASTRAHENTACSFTR